MDLMDMKELSRGCERKNCSSACLLEGCSDQDFYWEEPMFGLIELVCVTVIYIPLMIFGLLGNILTILVVWLRPHMRSSTYLYLSSMAISDLLILLLLPLDLYKLWRPRPWPLGDVACKLTMFLSECCTFCTILHITFLSLERYLAVCWPITAKTVVTRRRTRAVIGCLWLGAAVSAAPVLVMVGVEDVGAEEFGLTSWREDGGWTGRQREQVEWMIDVSKKEGEQMALLDPQLVGQMPEKKETKTWDEEFGEFKWSENKEEKKTKERNGSQTDKVDNVDETDEDRHEVESKMGFDEKRQNKKKEDEGGGSSYGSHEGEIDRRECRCSDYAISSGLLSAMMILSNLYFLIPLCILGLVYSLIGRTLCLRPKSSRRDQSHRKTVKMLGVIVLAFILCWLPFHVGRTIFSLSLGSNAERQETHTDVNSNSETRVDSTHTDMFRVSENVNLSKSDRSVLQSLSPIEKRTTHALARINSNSICAETSEKIGTQSNNTVMKKMNSLDNTKTDLEDSNCDSGTNEDVDDTAHTYKQQSRFFDNTNNTPSHSEAATSTELYVDNTHNGTHFNGSYSDTHMYFLYYLSQYFNLVSSVLFYLSAAVNPLLYNLMSARYRLAVYSLVHKRSHSQGHNLRTLTAQQSTTTF